MREDPHVAAEGPCLRRAEGRGCALRSCVRLGWRVGASPALPLALARVGALHAWGIFLPHSLERAKGLIDNSWEKEPLLYFRRGRGGERAEQRRWVEMKGGSGSDAANIG